MTIADIQKRLDALATGMLAKALSRPHAEFTIRSESPGQIYLRWASIKGGNENNFKFFEGAPEAAFAKAEAWIAALPSPEKRKLDEFMKSLSETIELGKKADIDAEVVNPLLDLMKRISKNAITHAEAA